MITEISIQNFRCLRDLTVPLKPLTVLVGPNDSGKSVFLSALKTAAGSHHISREDYWNRDQSKPISIGTRTRRWAGKFESQLGQVYPAGDHMQPLSSFILPSQGIEMTSGGYPDMGNPTPIGEQGQMIPALIDHFLRRDRKRFNKFVEAARLLVQGLDEVEISTPDAARRGLELVIDKNFRLPADQASVGVRLILFFLALAYHPLPPRTILIEEPENGVHPKRLADIVRLLREITEGKHGNHAAQVILTTHSPYLLDQINLATDQVLVFHRNGDGSRTAEPADANRLKTFLDEYMLGEVWYNVGEEGLVARKSP